MSIAALRDDFLEFLRVRHAAPGTVRGREQSLGLFFAHLKTVGVTDLREVSRQTIQDFRLELMRCYTVGTVRVHLGSLRSFFAQLENTDAILLNPTLGVPLPKEERRLPKRILKPSEVRKMLDAPDTTPKGLRDRAMLELFHLPAEWLKPNAANLTIVKIHENDKSTRRDAGWSMVDNEPIPGIRIPDIGNGDIFMLSFSSEPLSISNS